jgi:hypothetical protein
LNTIDSKDIVGVNEVVHFRLVLPPSWNIFYVIDFGDDNNTEHLSKSSQESKTSVPIAHAYSVPGVYNVTLKTWNTTYSKVYSKIIRVEYPIPTGSLSVSLASHIIAFPTEDVELTLKFSGNPEPTNVRCIFQYGDDVEIHPVNLTEAKPIKKLTAYESSGIKNINFTCTNDLTVQSAFAVLTVMSYGLSDFQFQYLNPTPMSMTLVPVEPTVNYRHHYRSVSVPVNVTFHVSIPKFNGIHPGITVTWDFNDGTPIDVFTLDSKQKTHTFSSKRRIYKMIIKMESRFLDAYTYYHDIKLGVIDFHCGPTKFEFLRENTICKASGITGTPVYNFYSDTPFSSLSMNHFHVNEVMNGSSYDVNYQKYGFYIPYVQHSGETVYLEQPLIADYTLGDALALDIQPRLAYGPPWNVEFKVQTTSTNARPYTFCSMKLGDPVDRNFVYNNTHNITNTEPLVFSYTYTSLGKHTVDVACWNYISEKKITDQVEVVNSCFDSKGSFDRQYSISTHPMKVYTSKDLYISNRMNILCKNVTPDFQWYIYQVNSSGEINISIPYENPRKEGKGTFLIKRNTLSEGMFYILLNVSLSTTWISEYTYLCYIKPPPNAYIVGGDYVTGPKDLKFDALSESRIANGEFGENENLTFSWSCKRY